LGFRQILGIRLEDVEVLVRGRTRQYGCINELRDAGVPDSALERLADADAFRSIGLDRRQALWEITAKDRPQALFEGQTPADAVGENVRLPALLPSEHVVQDYGATSLSIKAHPVSFLRATLDQLDVRTAKSLASYKNGEAVKVAGLVLVRQRPGTAKGVWFMTIEDETGFSNLVLFPQVAEEYRKAILGARLFLAEGTVQVEGEVIHVIVKKAYDCSGLLRKLTASHSEDLPLLTLSRADEKAPTTDKRVEQGNLFGGSRDFR
jgi:error-prone DNA polymerase